MSQQGNLTVIPLKTSYLCIPNDNAISKNPNCSLKQRSPECLKLNLPHRSQTPEGAVLRPWQLFQEHLQGNSNVCFCPQLLQFQNSLQALLKIHYAQNGPTLPSPENKRKRKRKNINSFLCYSTMWKNNFASLIQVPIAAATKIRLSNWPLQGLKNMSKLDVSGLLIACVIAISLWYWGFLGRPTTSSPPTERRVPLSHIKNLISY